MKVVLKVSKSFGKQNWEIFGIYAGLHHNHLREIQAANNGNVFACFIQCVSSWLRREHNVDEEVEKPTLSRLAGIIEETGDKETAEGIRKEIKKKDEEKQKSKLLCIMS